MTERRIIGKLSVVFVLLALTFGLSACSSDAPDKKADAEPAAAATIEVPDVTGQDAAEGKSEIEEAGPKLTVEYSEEPENEDICTVDSQDETGEVAPDTTVILTLACQVEVPDVTDDSAAKAKKDIEAVGLTASYDTEPDDASLCTVTDQDVAGGDLADEGDDITLTLECEVKVPRVVGMGAEEAVSEIEANGDLTASYDTEPDDASLCTVESQDPEGGSTADASTDVTLTLDCEGSGDDEPLGGSDPDFETPEDDSSDYDTPSVPGSPTTEDFGTGKGRTGLCNDGTLSDSIGRPGACSQHGGVR